MNIDNVLEMAWKLVNSDFGFAMVLSVTAFIINKIYAAKPQWQIYADKYRGTIVSAIRQVEKTIPDNVDNKHVRRFDTALKIVCEGIARAEGTTPNAVDTRAIAEAINALHNEIK